MVEGFESRFSDEKESTGTNGDETLRSKIVEELAPPIPPLPPPRPEPDPPWPDPCKPDPLPWPRPGCPPREDGKKR